MKKSFFLIEVIISVSILSIVIIAILNIRDNNISYIKKYNDSNIYNDYISLASQYKTSSNIDINTDVYLDKLHIFKDDDLRKEFKDIKVYIKKEIINTIDLSSDEFTLSINIIKNNYKIENKVNKNFYLFSLEY